MCKVIAISNQKGGTAKTTTTVNLGIGLAKEGKKVLLIDCDSQGSATASLGVREQDQLEVALPTIIGKIINDEEFDRKEGIIHHKEGIDLMPCNIELAGLEQTLINVMRREFVLKQYVDYIAEDYDYILLDCMPSLGMITINALTAADSILIPCEPSYLPIVGLEQLLVTIGRVRKYLNPRLKIEGVLFTIVDRRTNFSKDIMDLVIGNYGKDLYIFKNVIPKSVRAKETCAEGVSIYSYAPKGIVAAAYENLVKKTRVSK